MLWRNYYGQGINRIKENIKLNRVPEKDAFSWIGTLNDGREIRTYSTKNNEPLNDYS